MAQVRDEWIGFALNSGRQPTRAELQPIVDWYYSKFSKAKPIICICESPMAMQLAINIMRQEAFWKRMNGSLKTKLSSRKVLGDSVGNSVWDSVGNSVWNSVGNSVGNSVRNSVENSVWNSVRDSVGNSVGNSVWNSVWNSVRDSVGNSVWNSVWNSVRNSVWIKEGRLTYHNDYTGIGWESWLSFYEYFRRIGVLKGKEAEEFDRYAAFQKAGVWESAFFEKMVFVCTLPTKVIKDGQGRLHSLTEGAVQWKDGEEYLFVHGVEFDRGLWTKLKEKTLTALEAIKLQNTERRQACMQVIGWEIALKQIGAQVIDTLKASTPEGKKVEYQLLKADFKDDSAEAKLIRMEDYSTDRVYIERVPPTTKSCIEALAWQGGFKPEEYGFEYES